MRRTGTRSAPGAVRTETKVTPRVAAREFEGLVERLTTSMERTQTELTTMRTNMELSSPIHDASRVLETAQRVATEVVSGARREALSQTTTVLQAMSSAESTLDTCERALASIEQTRRELIAERRRLKAAIESVNAHIAAMIASEAEPDWVFDQPTPPLGHGLFTERSTELDADLADRPENLLPGFGEVLDIFKKTKNVLSRKKLTSVLDEVALLATEPRFAGASWLGPVTEPIWSSARDASWHDQYFPLIRFLFDVGLLGVQPDSESPAIFAGEDRDYVLLPSDVEEGTKFAVDHAARPLTSDEDSRAELVSS